MEGATHYIEQFKTAKRSQPIQGNIQPIKYLKTALTTTQNSRDLKTVAVWKIKFKPGYLEVYNEWLKAKQSIN